jgi:hypothetical protein
MQDNLKCTEFVLGQEHLGRLEQVSRIEFGFPHDFLISPTVRDFAFGGSLGRIDNPNDPALSRNRD